MSQFLTTADLMRDRANAHFASLGEGWEGVKCLVYRQKDIESEMDMVLAKAGGAAVAIVWDGFSMNKPDSRIPDATVRYSLSVWCQPTADADKPAEFADQVVTELIRCLHGWQSDPDPQSHCSTEVHILGGDLVKHPSYLCYELRASVKTLL